MNRGFWLLAPTILACASAGWLAGCGDDDPTDTEGGSCMIIVTEPAVGDVWVSERAQRIGWISSGGGEGVRIDLYRGNTQILAITEFTPNDGSTSWNTTLADHATGTNYRLLITSLSRPDCSAFSDTFTFVNRTECQFEVIAPSLRDSWRWGDEEEIQWTSNSTSGWVKIELVGGPQVFGEIAPQTQDDGSYIWSVWSFNGGSAHYIVKVSDVYIPECAALSEWFHLEDPTACWILFTSPQAGETWRVGENRTIAWDHRYVSGYIKIDLFHGTALAGQVASITENDSTYVWTVTTFGAEPGGFYRFEITDAFDRYCHELGPSFNILPPE